MKTPPLPPELFSAIINHAAESDSFYGSYKVRLRTLSSLSLVNRTFHDFSQPLVPQKVYCRDSKRLKKILQGDVAEKVRSLTCNHGRVLELIPFSRFVNLLELRLDVPYIVMKPIGGHQHLARLAIENAHLEMSANLILPQLVELSLDNVTVFPSNVSPVEGSANFLSISRLPSLRALALRKLKADVTGGSRLPMVGYSLLSRLDCIVADRVYPFAHKVEIPQPPSKPLSYPVRFLLDLTPSQIDGVIRYQLGFALRMTRVRIRLPCDPIPGRNAIEEVLSLVETLLNDTTMLLQLYLDFIPRRGRSSFLLDTELGQKVEKFENLAIEKNVENIWERHEDDWCRSLVSNEFWRRSREKKERGSEGNRR
ncbi:uncharacterized protein JCM6883_003751 [Sporobolomyces salmoneus]|uniref:uncharacterized protein n=1 Tax=Sporobolomyces salmoneus TaxID=183962 RepID=UPI00317D3DD0